MTNLVAFVYALFLTFPGVINNPTPIQRHCSEVTVAAWVNNHLGTGMVITRTNQDKTIDHYVWTAGHLVRNARHVPKFLGLIPNGKPTWDEIGLTICRRYPLGELTNHAYFQLEWNFRGKVVKFSDDEDLALVRVVSTNDYVVNLLNTNNTIFHSATNDVDGKEIYHLGSYLGEDHPQPITPGLITTEGNGYFWKCLVEGYPGSSGGGVFLKDSGECVGMVLRTGGPVWQLCAPVSRMRAWARREGISWAIDLSSPMPAKSTLSAIPIEDGRQ